jgi:hypothetical protein
MKGGEHTTREFIMTGSAAGRSEVAGASNDHETAPPGAPDAPRRVHLYAAQWIGLPFLAVLPVLAMVGVFGETTSRATATMSALEIDVEYPARIRTGQVARLEVVVRNVGPVPTEDVRVRFDPDWFEGAANLLITPAAESPLEVLLPRIEAGGEEHVRVEFHWESLWLKTGSVSVEQPSATPASLLLRTFIYP